MSLNPTELGLDNTNLSFNESLIEIQGDGEEASGLTLGDQKHTLNIPPTISISGEMMHSTVVDASRVGTSPATGTISKSTSATTGLPQSCEEIAIPRSAVSTPSQMPITSSILTSNVVHESQVQGRINDASDHRFDFPNVNFPNPSDARYTTVPVLNSTISNTSDRNIYIRPQPCRMIDKLGLQPR